MSSAPISARPQVFYVRPAPGWLDLVHEEVLTLVSSPLQKYKFEPKVTRLQSTVKIHRCDWRQGLELLTRLTTAHDVEWLILESHCGKWPDVDAILGRVPWDDVLPRRNIEVHVNSDTSNGFTSSSGKIRDNLCKIAKVTHVAQGATIRLEVELRGELLRVLASLAGPALYKRGYKKALSAVAPLSEHQAAACIHWVLAGQTDETPVKTVCVPFAGSGTFGFEALTVLAGAGPGAFPREFACDQFPATPAPTMKFLRRKVAEKLTTAPLPRVLFNDFNPEAIAMLKQNVAAFPVRPEVEIHEGDFFSYVPPCGSEGKILTLLNPPYGDRLAPDASIPALYAKIGKRLGELNATYPGRMLGGILCPDEKSWSQLLKGLAVASAETHHFTHGGKEMRLVRWQA